MIITVKYFYDMDQNDTELYNKLWDENKDRIIMLQTHLNIQKRMFFLLNDIQENHEKDILALKFPSFLYSNYIIEEIRKNRGIKYDNNKLWYPNEIWIYGVHS